MLQDTFVIKQMYMYSKNTLPHSNQKELCNLGLRKLQLSKKKIINTCDVLTYNEKFANDNKILQVQHQKRGTYTFS